MPAALNTAYSGLKRLIKAVAGLATYIANNAVAIVNYSERWRNGERISTAFVESTVNLVISRRFAKKQQMQWSKVGAHRLLQTRTKALDGTLRDLFTRWYPDMAVNDNQVPALARRPNHLPGFAMLPKYKATTDSNHGLPVSDNLL